VLFSDYAMHVPVLTKEVIKYLDPKPNQNFIDATVGGGGHTAEILEKIKPYGKVLGIDWSEDAIMKLQKKFKKEIDEGRLTPVCDNFANIETIQRSVGITPISGILLDLGLSRDLLETSGLGFSFRKDEPLVMTYHRQNRKAGKTAYDVVNTFSQGALEKIFREFGEERLAGRISRKIISRREASPIKTSRELARIVEEAVGRRQRLHPATRVFQAIRIFVNDELANLQRALSQSLTILAVDGRLVVISYHSLEDRIVKNTFRQFSQEKLALILTKKPVTASREEISRNPSSRSAKLRAVKKLPIKST